MSASRQTPDRSTLRTRRDARQRPTLTGLGFISPWLLGFLLFTAYPFVASLYWSLCRYDLLTPPEYVGLENYQRLWDELKTGDRFAQALWNTTYYALVSVPLSVLLGLVLAMMLSWKIRGRAAYRTLIYLPTVVPVVAASILWMWLLDPEQGLVNHLLAQVGVPAQNWFHGVGEAANPIRWWRGGNGLGSKDALVLMSLWGIGNVMVIYLAAIGDVPQSLHEAAALDGAGRIKRVWHVTLPMLSPVIFFNLLMGLIQSVQAFTQVYITSEGTGAPAGASLLISLHLLLSGYQDLEMGYASAIAWIFFVILLLMTIGLFRWARQWVHYRGMVA